MKKILMSLITSAIVMMSGCSIDGSMDAGSVAEEDLNKIMTCTRVVGNTNEKLVYNTNTMTNIRQGFGNAEVWTLDVVTVDGVSRHLKESDGWSCDKSAPRVW